jgi:hypothetical protein
MWLVSWMAPHLHLTSHQRPLSQIQCTLITIMTLWWIISLHMVWMVEYFFVLSTFQVAGMISLQQQIFCLSFVRRLGDTKCVWSRLSKKWWCHANSCGSNKSKSSPETCPKSVSALPTSQSQAQRLTQNLRPYLLHLSNVYFSLHQASEWGMKGLQGSFPRCKKRLPGSPAKCKLVIQSIVFAHNFWTENLGLNQIRTVFDPLHERYLVKGMWQDQELLL